MFGVAKICTFGAEDREQGGGLAAPTVVSVDSQLSVCNDIPPGFSNVGFKDCITLGGGPIVEADTEYLYTHFSESVGAFDSTPPPFPGPAWTAYTQTPGDRNVSWDKFGSENGPLIQPTAAGPYTGADPWNNAKNASAVDGDGGARWKRILITVKNAAGQDTAEVFYQDDCF